MEFNNNTRQVIDNGGSVEQGYGASTVLTIPSLLQFGIATTAFEGTAKGAAIKLLLASAVGTSTNVAVQGSLSGAFAANGDQKLADMYSPDFGAIPEQFVTNLIMTPIGQTSYQLGKVGPRVSDIGRNIIGNIRDGIDHPNITKGDFRQSPGETFDMDLAEVPILYKARSGETGGQDIQVPTGGVPARGMPAVRGSSSLARSQRGSVDPDLLTFGLASWLKARTVTTELQEVPPSAQLPVPENVSSLPVIVTPRINNEPSQPLSHRRVRINLGSGCKGKICT